MSRISDYARRIKYEWWQIRNRAGQRRRRKYFDHWFRKLCNAPPDVIIGANFAAFGGVRHHLHAIRKYSSLRTELVPSDPLMRKLSAHQFSRDFDQQLRSMPLDGVRVVHSHVFPWFTEWCSELQKRGILWIHTYHNHYHPEFAKNGILEPWQEQFNASFLHVAPRADVRLSVSKWQSRDLLEKYGIATDYLPNGVDIAICDAARPERFVKNFKVKDFILYVGRNESVKNPLDFVKLAARLPAYRFVMVGGGLSNDTLQRDWEADIPSNLMVVGPLSHSRVQDAIAACSVLVVTSKREGLPTLVMEGMAQRKAVVVPDEQGCLEVVDHGKYGYVYRLGDIDDLAHQTLQAMEDTSMGEEARQRVLREYDWRVIAPKLDAIYRGESF